MIVNHAFECKSSSTYYAKKKIDTEDNHERVSKKVNLNLSHGIFIQKMCTMQLISFGIIKS